MNFLLVLDESSFSLSFLLFFTVSRQTSNQSELVGFRFYYFFSWSAHGAAILIQIKINHLTNVEVGLISLSTLHTTSGALRLTATRNQFESKYTYRFLQRKTYKTSKYMKHEIRVYIKKETKSSCMANTAHVLLI